MAPDPVTPPADSSKPHIRTYAGDVAALTGKPLAKKVVNTPAPAPVQETPPPEPPPAMIIPKAPTTGESKEEVLARLRARAAEHTPVQKETPDYVPAPSAPSTSESKEEVLKRLKQRASQNVAAPMPPMPKVEKPTPPPERLHTYTSDFAARATNENATRISVLAAQADAAPAVAKLPEQKRPNVMAFVLGGILIVAGIGAVYAAYRFATGSPPIPQEQTIPSLIFADERVRLEGSAEDLRASLAKGADVSLSPGEAAITYLSYSTTTEEGTIEIVATGAELVEALRLPAPSLLLRAIEPESTVGVVRTESETRPFFLFRVDSYDRSFAGMLDWEATMERDLALFYPAYPVTAPPEPISTSTASTTPVAPPPFRLSFVDEVESNRDIRVLKDAENRTLMLYGFYDKRTLILARDEAAFEELVTRLSSTLR
jgi:hypothetical protein